MQESKDVEPLPGVGEPSAQVVLDTYDWEQAFTYADFKREDVAEIIALHEGENDGPPWVILVKLNSGIFGYLEAGCDYTGWDCRAGGHSDRDADLANLIRMKLSKDNRARLGVAIPEDGWKNLDRWILPVPTAPASEPPEGPAAELAEAEKGFVIDCLVMRREGEKEVLFRGRPDGTIVASLRGYAVIPIEQYNTLASSRVSGGPA